MPVQRNVFRHNFLNEEFKHSVIRLLPKLSKLKNYRMENYFQKFFKKLFIKAIVI